MKRIKQSLLVLGLPLLSSASLLATTSTWDGDTSSLFSTAGNWDAAPSTGDALVFPSLTGGSYTVDFTAVTPNNGPITFNASSDYLLTPAGQILTLSGDITQSGSGAVTSDINLDLGGATRSFGGAGTGLVRFNGVISGTSAGLNISGGTYALAAVNTFDGGLAANGGTVKIIQPGFGDLDYQPGSDPAGLGAVTLNGGRIELVCEDSLGTIGNRRTSTFGASGGTVVYSNYNKQIAGNGLNQNVINGPARIEAYPARLPITDPVAGTDNGAGAVQFQNPQGAGVATVVLRNGAAARLQRWLVTPFGGTLIIDGQPGGDMLADQNTSAPNQGTNIAYLAVNNPDNTGQNFPPVTGGILLKNAIQMFFTHSNNRQLDSDVTVTTGARVACMGRPLDTKTQKLQFGKTPGVRTFTVENDGVAQLDLQFSYWTGGNPGGSVDMNSKVLLNAGGTMRVARTTGSGNVANIAFFSTITGQGTAAKEALLDLQLDNGSGGNNGVTFNAPGVNLVVNGTGTGGLRVQAKSAAAMANLLTGRTDTITGNGGMLTLAVTNNDLLTDIRGPGSPSAVALGLDKQGGNSPTYVFKDNSASLANWAGLVLKGGTVVENDSSANSMQALTLAASATIQMGTAGGSGAILNFADSSAKTWSGTLTIANWNGAVYGGGADQIKFGTGVGGLTPAQLAQVTWINPFGAGNVTGAFQLATGEIVPLVGQSSFVASSIVPPNVGASTPFSATVNGIAGTNYRVLASDDIYPASWTQIATGTGTFSFNDPASLTKPQRFYKVVTP